MSPSSDNYREAKEGSALALGVVLVHEMNQVVRGPAEQGAYRAELEFLLKVGASRALVDWVVNVARQGRGA